MRRTPHSTPHTPHTTSHTPHATRHTPHATPHNHKTHPTRHNHKMCRIWIKKFSALPMDENPLGGDTHSGPTPGHHLPRRTPPQELLPSGPWQEVDDRRTRHTTHHATHVDGHRHAITTPPRGPHKRHSPQPAIPIDPIGWAAETEARLEERYPATVGQHRGGGHPLSFSPGPFLLLFFTATLEFMEKLTTNLKNKTWKNFSGAFGHLVVFGR